MSETLLPEAKLKDLGELRIHLIKSNNFRVVYADGLIGGKTPSGLINFAFYNERPAIPTLIVHPFVEENSRVVLGIENEEKREGRKGIVRELEVEVLMSVDNASRFHEWLGILIQAQKSALTTG